MTTPSAPAPTPGGDGNERTTASSTGAHSKGGTALLKKQIERWDSNVPQRLRESSQWLLWRYEKEKSGRITKRPYQCSGRLASSTDPLTWCGFEEAVDAYARASSFDGIGYAMNPSEGLVGIDIDNCIVRNEDGEFRIEPVIDEILRKLDSYTEVTPSGLGLRVFLESDLPFLDKGNGRKLKGIDGCTEFFVCRGGKYLTITGFRMPNLPRSVEPRQEEINALWQRYGGKTGNSNKQPVDYETRPFKGRLPDRVAGWARTIPWLRERFEMRADELSSAGKLAHDDHSESAVDMSLASRLARLCAEHWEIVHSLRCRHETLGLDQKRDDYYKRTAERALASGRAGPQPEDEAFRPYTPSSPSEMVVLGGHPADEVEKIVAAVRDSNAPSPWLFHRAGALVRPGTIGGSPILREIKTKGDLDSVILYSAHYAKETDSGPKPTQPTQRVIAIVHSRLLEREALPEIRGVAPYPILRRDGSIMESPGYDAESKFSFLPPAELKLPEIPERPTRIQVRESSKRLKEIFSEFPFVSAVNRTNALALLPALGLRHLIPGPAPAFGFTANEVGSGKTKLASLPYLILHGRSAPVSSWPTERDADAEVRKVLTSNLLSGASFLLFDNVRQPIKSESLAALLTGTGYRDRVLGESRTVEISEIPIVVFTGNHLTYGRDIARRFCTVKLDAKNPKPWERTGFKHPQLEKYVLENHARLVADFLTISRRWVLDGMPRGQTCARREDNFRDFVELVSGWLESAGSNGFHTNSEDAQSLYEDEAGEWAVFLDSMYGWSQRREFKIRDLAGSLLDAPPPDEQKRWQLLLKLKESIPPTCQNLHEALRRLSRASLESCLGWQLKIRLGTRFELEGAELWLTSRIVSGSNTWRVHRSQRTDRGG